MLKSSYLFSRVSKRGRTLCSLTWRGCWRPPRTWLATWNLPLPVWSNQRADCCRAGSSSSAGLWQGSWVSCRYDFMNEWWMNEGVCVCDWVTSDWSCDSELLPENTVEVKTVLRCECIDFTATCCCLTASETIYKSELISYRLCKNDFIHNIIIFVLFIKKTVKYMFALVPIFRLCRYRRVVRVRLTCFLTRVWQWPIN